jgi:hypothetical protein
MMTFKEAKVEADRIGGVVDWWWIYSVYTAEEWHKFNGSHGYGKYISKAAKAFFNQKYREYKRERDAAIAEVRRKIKAGISPWATFP